jgi:hypothetical protein
MGEIYHDEYTGIGFWTPGSERFRNQLLSGTGTQRVVRLPHGALTMGSQAQVIDHPEELEQTNRDLAAMVAVTGVTAQLPHQGEPSSPPM